MQWFTFYDFEQQKLWLASDIPLDYFYIVLGVIAEQDSIC